MIISEKLRANVKMITTVLYNKNILPSYYKLGLEVEGFSDCLPGQFVMLKVSSQSDPLLRRPFGIYKILGQGLGVRGQMVEILYKVVGRGTAIMSKLKQRDEVDVLGPLGNSFPNPPLIFPASSHRLNPSGTSLEKRGTTFSPSAKGGKGGINIIMVAGGIGIVPFYLLGLRLKAEGLRLKILFGGRHKDDLPGLDDFRKLNIDISISTDDGSVGRKGFVTELLKKEFKTHPRPKGQGLQLKTVVYACGPKPMLKAAAAIAEKNNIPCYVSLDSVMACGVGACLGCAVKVRGQGSMVNGQEVIANLKSETYKMVCKDGPVFNANDIDWEEI